jgi:chemotaxis protein CheY-P-specific phosphatase CheC
VSAFAGKHAELTARCAVRAAETLGQLLDAELSAAPPRSWILPDGRLPAELFSGHERVTAVLAELEGAASGPAGLILRRDLLQWMLRRLTGDGNVKTLSERALSALCEVGNIAVSAAANALGEVVGGVVLPSVPRLGFEKAAAGTLEEVCGEVGSRCAYLVELTLQGSEGAFGLLFVWVPQA